MKKQIASLVLATALVFPTAAFAEETTPVVDPTQTEVQVEQPVVEPSTEVTTEAPVEEVTTTDTTTTEQPAVETTTDTTTTVEVDPGLTPEDATYFLDTFFENVQLTFTFDAEAKAQVYAEISAERLAELQALDPATQSEFVKDLLVAYDEALTKAGEQVEEATADGTVVSEETTDLLDQVATEGEEAVADASDELEAEEVEGLEDSITSVKYTAAVVRNIDPEVVQTLREQGIGFGKIALTVAISNLSGKTVEEVTDLLKESGVGKVAKDLGIHPGKLKDAKMTIAVETEDATTEASEEQATVEEQAPVVEEVTTETETETETATQTLNVTDTAKAKAKVEKEVKVSVEKKEEAKKKAEVAKEKAEVKRENARENSQKQHDDNDDDDHDNERDDD